MSFLTSQASPNLSFNPRFESLVLDNQSCIIYNPSTVVAQAITSGIASGVTILQNATLIQGTDISFNPATGAITFNVAGLYDISYSIEWGLSGLNGSNAKVYLRDNLTAQRYYSSQIASSSTTTLNSNGSGLIRATAGQVLTLLAEQSSGSPQDIQCTNVTQSPNSLCVYRLS